VNQFVWIDQHFSAVFVIYFRFLIQFSIILCLETSNVHQRLTRCRGFCDYFIMHETITRKRRKKKRFTPLSGYEATDNENKTEGLLGRNRLRTTFSQARSQHCVEHLLGKFSITNSVWSGKPRDASLRSSLGSFHSRSSSSPSFPRHQISK
jgi:hypothetical protein